MDKQWRPKEGWDDTKFEFSKGEPQVNAIYEAGADAMLEALLLNSVYYSGYTEIGEGTTRGMELAFQRKPGRYIFIPAEETDGHK